MFFDRIEAAPADPILGLTDAYKKDPNKDKVNLGVGVYQNNEGKTVILNCVKAAEKVLLDTEETKSYLPITGLPEYGRLARELIFGAGSELVDGGRAVHATVLVVPVLCVSVQISCISRTLQAQFGFQIQPGLTTIRLQSQLA